MHLIGTDTITFSFGKNWKEFLSTLDDDVITEAGKDIDDWLGGENIRGKSIVDIGSGSGLSSLCMYRRGCRRLVSFDYDSHSVEATKLLAGRAGSPDNWEIFEGSILDEALIDRLGTFDVVHSWGVLHHTGDMWKAIENSIRLCGPDGLFFISLYTGGDLYEEHLALKRRFNGADEATKREMVLKQLRSMDASYKAQHPDSIARDQRGMTQYHDAVDWLGGLPYEVAHVSEVVLFGTNRGLRPLRVFERGQGGCSLYLFKKDPNQSAPNRVTFEWSSFLSDKKEERNLERQLSEDFKRVCKTVQRQRAQMNSLKSNARRCLGIVRQRLFQQS
jgi:2-polyprenyl-6-hydroxyphenyl methylase/3-demethylubiquinone-9 3-methyltransferase